MKTDHRKNGQPLTDDEVDQYLEMRDHADNRAAPAGIGVHHHDPLDPEQSAAVDCGAAGHHPTVTAERALGALRKTDAEGR